MHLVRVGRSPAHLADMMTATADLPGRERLRSANSFRTKPQNWSSSLVSEVSRIRWTEGVELTSRQSSRTNKHWYF